MELCVPVGSRHMRGSEEAPHCPILVGWAAVPRSVSSSPRLSPPAPQAPEKAEQYLFDLPTYHFPTIDSCPSGVPISGGCSDLSYKPSCLLEPILRGASMNGNGPDN